MKNQFYLDAAATTPLHPEVQKEVLKAPHGNPSSLHLAGEKAKYFLNNAREKIAREINCKPHEIIFTSGGTESNNLAIQGLTRKSKKKKILVSSIEHPSVLETCKFLASKGFRIVKIPVSSEGLIDQKFLEKELTSDTALVSVMHVNNILGTIQDIEKIGRICKKKKIPFHTDAVQSFGKIKIDVKKQNISLLSASAHKIGGPKGIGFAYINEQLNLSQIIFGGGQERNLRSGTQNVPGAIGFAKALEISTKQNKTHIEESQKYLAKLLTEEKIKINSSVKNNIYNILNFSVPEIEADTLVMFLSQQGIYLSAGSACDSITKEDHVLKEIGLSDKEAKSSLRISLHKPLTRKECEFVVHKIIAATKILRQNI